MKRTVSSSPPCTGPIPKDTICVCICRNDSIIATGLGILDRDYVGVYAIHVQKRSAVRAWPDRSVPAFWQKGKKRSDHAYLQVTAENERARRLYASLGFSYFYTYYFRIRQTF